MLLSLDVKYCDKVTILFKHNNTILYNKNNYIHKIIIYNALLFLSLIYLYF